MKPYSEGSCQEIARRADMFYEMHGREDSRDLQNWLAAEAIALNYHRLRAKDDDS